MASKKSPKGMSKKSPRSCRKAPVVKAKDLPAGTKRIGLDGFYVVSKRSNGTLYWRKASLKSPEKSPGKKTSKKSPKSPGKKTSKKSPTKLPGIPAKHVVLGTTLKGGDGNDYIVAQRDNGSHYWKKFDITKKGYTKCSKI